MSALATDGAGRETIAAVATAPGAGGVAVVRVSGDAAFAVAERLTRGCVTRPGGPRPEARVAALYSPSAASAVSRLLDTAVVLAFRAPHSYTGEDVVEFQCHGGTVTPRRVLEACFAAGARPARRGEFTERAFLNGRLDYDQAESVLNLIEAKTDRAADAALAGLSGRAAHDGRSLYEQALAASAELEHALDVDEGELPPAFFARVGETLRGLDAALAAAAARLRERRMLRTGATVVLAGPPNAGKSSLLNALVGESRAIVSEVPGTTRDSIEAWVDLGGWPVRLVDTAGLRETGDAIEAEGVRRAERLIATADVVIALVGREGDERDRNDERDGGVSDKRGVRDGLAQTISINPKCDLSRSPSRLNVSAKTGEGLDALKCAVVAALEAKAASAEEAPCGDGERGLAVLYEARTRLAPVLADAADGGPLDLVLAGNAVRGVAEGLGAWLGATYSADLLDRLFSRFCVGK